MIRPRPPSRDEHLTVDDVEELPNGMSTVVVVESPTAMHRQRCRIDDLGYLRTLDDAQLHVPSEWRVVDAD